MYVPLLTVSPFDTDSEGRSRDSYEDDYHYDGEREDSDIESPDPHSSRRYRDKERVSPSGGAQLPHAPVAHSTTGSGVIGAASRVHTKQPQSSSSSTSVAKPPSSLAAGAGQKRIDMGAASAFGKADDLGINSPTHRNTHAEEDLFDNNNTIVKPVFKTCPPPSPPSSRAAVVSTTSLDNNGDFDFNPREDENEFGDFASAFGGTAAAVPALPASSNGVFSADFAGAFVDVGAAAAPATNANLLSDGLGSADDGLLFGVATTSAHKSADISLFGSPLASSAATLSALMGGSGQATSSAVGGDLLSDFGGLNMNSPVFNGEYR